MTRGILGLIKLSSVLNLFISERRSCRTSNDPFCLYYRLEQCSYTSHGTTNIVVSHSPSPGIDSYPFTVPYYGFIPLQLRFRSLSYRWKTFKGPVFCQLTLRTSLEMLSTRRKTCLPLRPVRTTTQTPNDSSSIFRNLHSCPFFNLFH